MEPPWNAVLRAHGVCTTTLCGVVHEVSFFLFLSIAHPSLHVRLVCVAHRKYTYVYIYTRTHRGKVPTESREENKRRPCPLQTSSFSFFSCFSPLVFSPSLLLSTFSSLSFFFFFLRSELLSGSFDWRAKAEEGREEEEEKEKR